jgi:RNA polymerase sigma-70 factor (ECF subfamily)
VDPTSIDSDSSLNSGVLVGRARGGSQAAWDAIYARYRKMLLAHVQARLPGFARRRLDAEDVLQTALLRAWQGLDTYEYRGEGTFRHWLARIVSNTCVDLVKNEGSAVLQVLETAALERGAAKEAHDMDERERRKDALLEAMGQMSEEDRDLLIQRNVEMLSFSAIGDILGFSREKARELYAAASDQLRRRMGA